MNVVTLKSAVAEASSAAYPEDCKCAFTQMTRRIVRNGATQIVRQCTTCGRATTSPFPRSAVGDMDRIPLFDESLIERWSKSRAAEFARVAAAKRGSFFDWYDGYLKSEEWRARREKVMQRCDGVCEGCGNAKAVQVHHLTYERVGREMLFDLVGICAQCHSGVHDDGPLAEQSWQPQ